MLASSLVVMQRLSALLLMDGNENQPAINQPQQVIGINTCTNKQEMTR